MAKIQRIAQKLWRPKTPGRHAKTPHLIERQKQRNITDIELTTAIEFGKKRKLPGVLGNIHYSYKGLVYVASPEGVGLTAYRMEKMLENRRRQQKQSVKAAQQDSNNSNDRSAEEEILKQLNINEYLDQKK